MLRVLAIIIVVVASGCATLGQECASALLQATAQICVDVLCDDDSGDDLDDPSDHEPTRAQLRRESPAPDWQPRPGSCEFISDPAGGVTVACADGTRATFLPGTDPLVVERSSEGARGDACRDGSVVREGLDSDGDGALSPGEVTGHTVDCPARDGVRAPTLVGHLAIYGPDDVARVAGRRAVTGGLLLRSARLTRLELPQLQSLGATLRVEGTPALEQLALPNLASVAGDVVIVRALRLRSLHAPALVRVGGAVTVVDNPALPQSDVLELVFRLSRHGYAGPVELAGNRP